MIKARIHPSVCLPHGMCGSLLYACTFQENHEMSSKIIGNIANTHTILNLRTFFLNQIM